MATKEWVDSTRGNYVKMWNNHVKDDLGNMKVVQTSSLTCQNILRENVTGRIFLQYNQADTYAPLSGFRDGC